MSKVSALSLRLRGKAAQDPASPQEDPQPAPKVPPSERRESKCCTRDGADRRRPQSNRMAVVRRSKCGGGGGGVVGRRVAFNPSDHLSLPGPSNENSSESQTVARKSSRLRESASTSRFPLHQRRSTAVSPLRCEDIVATGTTSTTECLSLVNHPVLYVPPSNPESNTRPGPPAAILPYGRPSYITIAPKPSYCNPAIHPTA